MHHFLSFVWFGWRYLTARTDLKQPLSLSKTETEMENGVRSNQHCCHDSAQFTPTCNQATGRAATKLMWQWQVDWKWKDRQEAWAGVWRDGLAQCSLVLSSPSHSPSAAHTRISYCTIENHRHVKQNISPMLFCPCTTRQCFLHYHLLRYIQVRKTFDLIPLKICLI